MTGDQADILGRLRAVIPSKWFPDDSPVLTGVLSGVATVWEWSYQLLQYAKRQTRIATASGVFLDIASGDYFGYTLPRKKAESDNSYSARIRREFWRPKGTRAAVVRAVNDLTGHDPGIFEPANTSDTGGWAPVVIIASIVDDTGHVIEDFSVNNPIQAYGMGYNVAGGYGSLELPFQFFATVRRASTATIANTMGYYTGTGWAGGGYGAGAIKYIDSTDSGLSITDDDIYQAIAGVLPAATIGWVKLTNGDLSYANGLNLAQQTGLFAVVNGQNFSLMQGGFIPVEDADSPYMPLLIMLGGDHLAFMNGQDFYTIV